MDDTTSELRSELGIAAGMLRRLRMMAHAKLKTPGNAVRWGPVDLEATNALDSLSTAPTFPTDAEESQETSIRVVELATQVAVSVKKAVELARTPEDKLACLDAAVHVSRLQRALL